MKPKKVLSELNSVFNEKHLLKAIEIEVYQEPHNYYPKPELLHTRDIKELSIHDIRNYEKEHGPSCSYKNIITREPCLLYAEEHQMKNGVILLVKTGTTEEQVIDEVCRVITVFEKHNIAGVSQVKETI